MFCAEVKSDIKTRNMECKLLNVFDQDAGPNIVEALRSATKSSNFILSGITCKRKSRSRASNKEHQALRGRWS
jgi:hypothetical protein